MEDGSDPTEEVRESTAVAPPLANGNPKAQGLHPQCAPCGSIPTCAGHHNRYREQCFHSSSVHVSEQRIRQWLQRDSAGGFPR